MIYTEEICDLFTVPSKYFLAHCISSDFGMGAGIAVQFNKNYNMKNILKENYPAYEATFTKNGTTGDCIKIGRVFNLITKRKVYDKPTYDSLRSALIKCKNLCDKHGIKFLAMPLIGCGIDGLDWDKVKNIICEEFNDTDIDILVCKLK